MCAYWAAELRDPSGNAPTTRHAPKDTAGQAAEPPTAIARDDEAATTAGDRFRDHLRAGVKSISKHTSSFPILGFGAMSVAVWEQLLLLFGLALANGSTQGILITYLFTAAGYGLVMSRLAEMARRFPNSAGPFYWTLALQTPRTTFDLAHQMSWLCAWMSAIGLGINFVVNTIYVSDVALFLFSLAGKGAKFVYHSEEPTNSLRVPWALPLTIGISIGIALALNLWDTGYLPALQRWSLLSHWLGFLLFAVAIPIICERTVGLNFTV